MFSARKHPLRQKIPQRLLTLTSTKTAKESGLLSVSVQECLLGLALIAGTVLSVSASTDPELALTMEVLLNGYAAKSGAGHRDPLQTCTALGYYEQ